VGTWCLLIDSEGGVAADIRRRFVALGDRLAAGLDRV
jgi:hypothetical protein